MKSKDSQDKISVYLNDDKKQYEFIKGILCLFWGLFGFNTEDLRDLAFSKRFDLGSSPEIPYCLQYTS